MPALKVLEKEGGVKIQGICDIDRDRLGSAGDKFDIKNRFTNYREMIRSVPIDGILILSSPHFTIEIATFCSENKKHLLIEKPPGMNLSQSRGIAELSRKSFLSRKTGDYLPHTIYNRSNNINTLDSRHNACYRCPCVF